MKALGFVVGLLCGIIMAVVELLSKGTATALA
jgi:hypothetical protein